MNSDVSEAGFGTPRPQGFCAMRRQRVSGTSNAIRAGSFALLLALSACTPEPKRIVEAIPIPPERMDCQPAGTRPSIPPEYVIDWTRVTSVPLARAEHDKYVGSVRTREGVVAGYVLEIEGKLFACSNDAAWLRDWQKGLTQ